jgi:hypothetical protein
MNEFEFTKLKHDTEQGIIVYGRNLLHQDRKSMHPVLGQALKCMRSPLTEKKQLRTNDTVTEEEIEMLEDKFQSQDMPEDNKSWIFTGSCYQNELSFEGERLYRHPNRDFLV